MILKLSENLGHDNVNVITDYVSDGDSNRNNGMN